MFKLMLIAGAGGFIGTSARYLINQAFLRNNPLDWPLATFAINILGCFLFGLITALFQRSGILSPKLNAFLVTGFCGGFTTFSTFSFEAFSMANSGLLFSSVLYLALSVILGLVAVWAGIALAS